MKWVFFFYGYFLLLYFGVRLVPRTNVTAGEYLDVAKYELIHAVISQHMIILQQEENHSLQSTK